LYAPCTIVEVLVSEAVGLVPRGEGAKAAARGDTALGGRIPVNTSARPIARGHPPYVPPLYASLEPAEQRRPPAGELPAQGAAARRAAVRVGGAGRAAASPRRRTSVEGRRAGDRRL